MGTRPKRVRGKRSQEKGKEGQRQARKILRLVPNLRVYDVSHEKPQEGFNIPDLKVMNEAGDTALFEIKWWHRFATLYKILGQSRDGVGMIRGDDMPWVLAAIMKDPSDGTSLGFDFLCAWANETPDAG